MCQLAVLFIDFWTCLVEYFAWLWLVILCNIFDRILLYHSFESEPNSSTNVSTSEPPIPKISDCWRLIDCAIVILTATRQQFFRQYACFWSHNWRPMISNDVQKYLQFFETVSTSLKSVECICNMCRKPWVYRVQTNYLMPGSLPNHSSSKMSASTMKPSWDISSHLVTLSQNALTSDQLRTQKLGRSCSALWPPILRSTS